MKKPSHSQNSPPSELTAEIEFLEKWVLHHDENLNHDTMFHTQLADRRKKLKRYDTTAEKADEIPETDNAGVGATGVARGESKHGS